MDRATIERQLAEAERVVAKGEGHIADQQAILCSLEREGLETAETLRLLDTLEKMQALHIADRDRLREELRKALPL